MRSKGERAITVPESGHLCVHGVIIYELISKPGLLLSPIHMLIPSLSRLAYDESPDAPISMGHECSPGGCSEYDSHVGVQGRSHEDILSR